MPASSLVFARAYSPRGASSGALFLQADGELLGRDPCRFRILPAALRFVC